MLGNEAVNSAGRLTLLAAVAAAALVTTLLTTV
jgi:hypothetical protein